MADHILDRLTFDPTTSIHYALLVPIPWQSAVAPLPLPFPHASYGPETLLPQADSVIVTWTAAEWRALTDVLAPSAEEREYVGDFAAYRADLTNRSPARAGYLAKFRMTQANGKTVLLVHSMLHLATDSPNLPLRRLIDQIIEETKCSRLITTGTAGGIGSWANLGDVVVGSACRFDLQKQFKGASFAGKSYPTMYSALDTAVIIKQWLDDGTLIGANFSQLASIRKVAEWQTADNEIITTDFFCFDTSDDYYGLQKFAPELNLSQDGTFAAVEMDDAVFGLVIADRLAAGKPAPHWAAVRNVSDPQADMTQYATEEDAAAAMGLIYRRWGYLTTIPSAIVSWLIAVS